MKNMKTALAATSTILMFSMAPVAFGQHPGLVSVDIRNVANNIAKNINVDVSKIPATVHIQANMAADVCKMEESILAEQQKNGGATCVAEITSSALDRTVERQIKGITQ